MAISNLNYVPIEPEDLNFGNLNRVQIDFIEMERQKGQIESIGNTAIARVKALTSAVFALASLVDCSFNSTDVSLTSTRITLALKKAINNMDYQISEYTRVNEEITEDIKNALDVLVEKLFDQGGFNSEEILDDGLTYYEAKKLAQARGGPADPDFSNSDAWQEINPYAKNYTGQCTWFAWGRFYEIYGYDPGFRGNGYECVGQLLSTHPEEFTASTIPVAGAVFSTVPYFNESGQALSPGHVGIILSVDGDTITYQDGNYDTYNNSFETAQSDWRTNTVTIEEFKQIMGQSVHFANPTTQVTFKQSDRVHL